MALKNLGAHTKGGLITTAQDTKEDTSNDLDDLLSDSNNKTSTFVVTAGGTLNLDTPQGNLDLYLESGLIRLTGTPAGAFTIIVPDGNKRIAFSNESGQAATIDTVTGATPTVAIPDSTVREMYVRGIEFTVAADDSAQTGALLADGSQVVTGDFNWGDFQIARAELKDYSETKTAPAAAATIDLDLANGNVFEVIMDQVTTFTFSNPPVTGKLGSFTLFLKQDGTGGRTPTWPASVDWEVGTPPTFSNAANQIDVVSFMTVDGGTTWFGFLGGLNFG